MRTVAGSAFRERVFIANKTLRKELVGCFEAHTSSGGRVRAGVVPDADTMNSLKRSLLLDENECQSLWPIVQTAFGGAPPGTVVRHSYMEIIRTLATNAPVCHLVKPHLFDIVDNLIHGGEPSFADLDKIHVHSPALLRFIKGGAGGSNGLDTDVRHLLSAMRYRAEAAYVVGTTDTEVCINILQCCIPLSLSDSKYLLTYLCSDAPVSVNISPPHHTIGMS